MNLATLIDHTNLRPEATPEDIRKLCSEAREHGFASVCTNSIYVPLAKTELAGSPVQVCSVVGFPLGAMSTPVKAFEAKQAAADGAAEVDMVLAIGKLKAGDLTYVEDDIRAVVEASRPAIVKVILEACLLSDAEKVAACQCAERAGAAFVKTSTGFSTGGATLADVQLMRATVGDRLGVKAAGGIHDKAFAEALVAAGAKRIGTSHGLALL